MKNKRALLTTLALTMLSTISYVIGLSLFPGTPMDVAGNARLNALAKLACCVLWAVTSFLAFYRARTRARGVCGKRYYLLAAFLAAVTVYGLTCQHTDGLYTASSSLSVLLAYLMMILGRTLFYRALFACFHEALSSVGKDKPVIQGGLSFKELILTGALLLLCWSPYYIICFPGAVSWDSVTQMQESLGMLPLNNSNPIMQTLWIRLCLEVGGKLDPNNGGIAFYTVTQMVSCALLFSGILMYGKYILHTPRSLSRLLTLYIAFHPVVPMYAICMGKDTNFALSIILFAMVLYHICTHEQAFVQKKWKLILLPAAAILMVMLRNAGIYLVLASLIIAFSFMLFKHRRGKAIVLITLACSLLTYGSIRLLASAANVEPAKPAENCSIPIQIAGRVLHYNKKELSQKQRSAIDAVLPIDKLGTQYQQNFADPLKSLWRDSSTLRQKAAFLSAVMTVAAEQPTMDIGAVFNMAYAYLMPGARGTEGKAYYFAEYTRNMALLASEMKPYHSEKVRAPLANALNRLPKIPVLRLFLAPGLFTWIALLCLFFTMGKRQKIEMLACCPLCWWRSAAALRR